MWHIATAEDVRFRFYMSAFINAVIDCSSRTSVFRRFASSQISTNTPRNSKTHKCINATCINEWCWAGGMKTKDQRWTINSSWLLVSYVSITSIRRVNYWLFLFEASTQTSRCVISYSLISLHAANPYQPFQSWFPHPITQISVTVPLYFTRRRPDEAAASSRAQQDRWRSAEPGQTDIRKCRV